MSDVELILSRLASIFGNPVLAVVGIVVVTFLLIGALTEKGRWYVFAGLLLVSTFAPAVNPSTDEWLQPGGVFNSVVLYGRTLTLFLFVLIAAVAVVTVGGGYRPPTVVMWALFAFHMVWCLRYMPTVYRSEAAFKLLTYGVLFVGLGMVLPGWLRTTNDLRVAIRAVGLVGVLCLSLNLFTYLVVGGNATLHGRLFGLTANPNHLGTAVGLFAPAIFVVLVSKGEPTWARVVALIGVGVGGVLIVLSGSRGGFGMVGVVAVVIFRVKLGRLFLFLGPLVAVVVVAMMALDLNAESADRLTSTENTRIDEWREVFPLFMESPLFGSSAMGMQPIPSSYVSTLVMMGWMGAIVLSVFVYQCFSQSIRLVMLGRREPELAFAGDYVAAGFMSILAIAVFEGTLFSTLAPAMFFLYFTMMVAGAVNRLAEGSAAHEQLLRQGYAPSPVAS